MRRLRANVGATASEVARSACLSVERYEAIERGVEPTFSEGMALARTFRVKLRALCAEVRR